MRSRIPSHRVILVTTFATKGKRQQNTTSVSRHVLLAIDRQIAVVLCFQTRIDGIPAGDELVEPERECWKPRFRIAFALIASEQPLLNDGFATLNRETSRVSQVIRRAIFTGKGPGPHAYQAACLRLAGYAKRAFDPAR